MIPTVDISYLLMNFFIQEHIYALSPFECQFSCNFHISWIHLYFIPYLKDSVLVFKIIIKLVSLFLNLVEFSNMLNYFQTLIFKNPYQPKGSWMGDHALYVFNEYLSNMCMNRVVVMSYT